MNYFLKPVYGILLISIIAGCKKTAFLDTPPDQSLVIPSTLKDFQGLLDNDHIMNGAESEGLLPAMGEMGCDNYYITSASYANYLNDEQRNIYTWAQQIYTGNAVYDWDFPYRSIFYCNTVLDGMAAIQVRDEEKEESDNIVGSALFYRAHLFYQLAQEFAAPYDRATADTMPGIPLRLKGDVNEPISRASLAQVYDRVISDIKNATQLLPVTPLYKTRPSKPAAYGLLSRIYQTMGTYDSSLMYADSCILLYHTLLDYNTLNPGDAYPIARYNDEVIFACNLVFENAMLLNFGIAIIDSSLYNSYDSNDLRRTIFFQDDGTGHIGFRGSYDGYFSNFGGIATDEIYLIKGECLARKGDMINALNCLNIVLEKRWQTHTFIPFTAGSAMEALNIILQERRKELLMRGLRWTDLRRLNKEANYAITLAREMNGMHYELPPGSKRYTYPIPEYVLNFHNTMPQNPR